MGPVMWRATTARALGPPHFAQKPVRAHPGSDLRPQHLDGDGAVVPQVAREINSGHAAASELAVELVAALQRLRERCGCVGHDGTGRGRAQRSSSFGISAVSGSMPTPGV
jgi:hypothetical protein